MSTGPSLLVDCLEVVELVTDYLEDALEPGLRDRVAAHLALCDGCATYLEQMRSTLRTLGSVPLDSLSDDAKSVLVAAFRNGLR